MPKPVGELYQEHGDNMLQNQPSEAPPIADNAMRERP